MGIKKFEFINKFHGINIEIPNNNKKNYIMIFMFVFMHKYSSPPPSLPTNLVWKIFRFLLILFWMWEYSKPSLTNLG